MGWGGDDGDSDITKDQKAAKAEEIRKNRELQSQRIDLLRRRSSSSDSSVDDYLKDTLG